jgi:hypothetical protein
MLIPFWGGGRMIGSGATEIRNGNLISGIAQFGIGIAYAGWTNGVVYGPWGVVAVGAVAIGLLVV